MSRVPQINIGILGLGVVGGEVYRTLHLNKELITKKLGFPILVKKICEINPKRKQDFPEAASLFVSKSTDILDDPEISIVVEMIGDKPIAKEVMLQALSLGKHVVTANKAILASHGPELYSEAAKNGVDILFEASVGGAIPILRSLREGLIADKIQSIWGIINGTANYILTEMSEKKAEFQTVLAQAQKLGLAEADPSSDIEGKDTANKLAILITLAYGQMIPLSKIHTEGISEITPLDHEMAARFGYTIKLLAISKLVGETIEARVHPTMIPQDHILAHVRGAFNAIMVEGSRSGKSLLYGLGAGGVPTSTAVVADIIEIARNIASQVPGVPPLGYKIENIQKGKVRPMEEIESEYYFRFNTVNKPGVLAKIAQILGQNNISISSVYQHEKGINQVVPIVVFVHQAKEKNVQEAIHEINKLPVVSKKTLMLRIEK